ncbi:MAG: hypothetical protein RIC87_08025 [Kiloniellales bacterium]
MTDYLFTTLGGVATVVLVGLLPAGLLLGVVFMLTALPFMRALPAGLARRYAVNLFIAGDQLANAILGGNPDMTISGRLGKRLLAGKQGCVWCYLLSKWLALKNA